MKIVTRKEAKAQGLKRYYPGSECKHGHVAERDIHNGQCMTCKRRSDNERNKKAYWKNREARLAYYKEWRRKNPDHKKRKDREYRAENKDEIERKAKLYREGNKAHKREYDRRYREQNKSLIADKKRKYNADNRERVNANARRRRRTDSSFAAKCSMLSLIHRTLRASGEGKNGQTTELLGYTPQQFKDHIERQFTKGMTWANRGEWQLDHITPVIQFIESGITDPAIINALPNLRPLWAADNMRKSDQVETLL